ncbi:MAG TPA: DUF4239 domain-containing protein [Candidatus Melainabacteria bacterium]|jgi:hypothetical protein|nr:DUF4239 domain-containing protein [Candidatus Melainabacteria bacterium]HIN65488.1 DUF4239 domain-containing protein [Candidatus Obscuribacterales bacterium]
MSSFTDCLLIVGLTTLLSVVGLLLVRKKFKREQFESCHEVGGFLLSVVGTLYAILVGLIVVNSQGKVDAASQMAVSEANMLSNIYHLSNTFKEPTRSRIHKHIYDYAVAAVNQDWSLVEEGMEKEATIPAYQALWKDITHYVPREDNESQCYATMLGNIQELSEARKYRMVAARGGLSPVLWSVLIAGGAMIVLFTYFFFVESLMAQAIMTMFVAVFLSLNVYLIYICQNPYRPELGAKEAGFGFSFTPNWFKDRPNVPHIESNIREKNEQPTTEVMTDEKSDVKTDVKTEVRENDVTLQKTETKTETKSEIKTDDKTETKQ